jgi:hypothetical protein
MADIIPLVRPRAPILSTTDTSNPETIRLHGLAENALSTALHCLRSMDCDPELAKATARAIRAATLLKRASEASITVEG